MICLGVSVVASVLGAPLSSNLYLLLVLPLYFVMPVSFYAGMTVFQVVLAAVVTAIDPFEVTALYPSACAVVSPIVLLGHLAAGRVPRSSGDPASWPAWMLRTGYGAAALLLAAALFWRDFAITATIPWFVFALLARLSLPGVPRRSWRERIAAGAGTAALGVLGLAGALGVLEAGARLIIREYRPYMQIHALHRDYYQTLRPKAAATYYIPVSETELKPVRTVISRQGLRDREYGPKDPGETRILLLGDSFVFGWATEVEDSIPRQLEEMLSNRLPDSRITVINGGISTTGPWQQHGLLRERCWALEPDLVIHSVFALNDVSDTLVRVGKGLEAMEAWEYGRMMLFRNRRRPVVALHFWLDNHSHLYNSLRTYWIPHDGVIVWANRTRGMPRLLLFEGYPGRPRNPWLETGLVDWYADLSFGFDLMTQDVLAIRADCHQRGILFAGFAAPHMFDVDDGAFLYAQQQAAGSAEYERAKGIHKTHRFYRDSGIPYIDVWTPIDQHPNPADLYYERDGHFNGAGSRFVAELLADGLILDYPDLLSGILRKDLEAASGM